MKVTLNGKQLELNIGCRSFIYVNQLNNLLDITQAHALVVVVNGSRIAQQDFAASQVKSADKIIISTAMAQI